MHQMSRLMRGYARRITRRAFVRETGLLALASSLGLLSELTGVAEAAPARQTGPATPATPTPGEPGSAPPAPTSTPTQTPPVDGTTPAASAVPAASATPSATPATPAPGQPGQPGQPVQATATSTPAATASATPTSSPTSPVPTLPPSAARETVLTTLRLSHPRLMLLSEDEARIRQALTSDAAARTYRDLLLRNGSRVITQPPPERVLTGSRLLTVSRTVLDRVMTLALLYRLDSDRRWVSRAREELLAAAAFSDWNPANFVDVAEMSHAFAIGYDWMYDALTPDDRTTIRRALVEKGLQPAAQEYTARAPWTRSAHSWNLVCNSAVVISALAIADEEPGLAGTLLAQALASLPTAIAAYAPDGAWPEGPSNWDYGTLYLVSALATLTSALTTDFGLGEAAGLAATGRFRLQVTGPTGLFFNFADATPRAGDSPMLFWLARRYNDPVLAVAARDAATGRSSARDLLWYDGRGAAADIASLPLDARYQDTHLAFFRSAWNDRDAVYVGFKGGDNTGNYAHLDLGTFVLDALGQRWAVDLGPDDPDLPGYFGAERWTYERLKTSGQNTLMLDGANQDPKATAALTVFRSSPDNAFAIADLTAAYAGGGATRVNRGVTLRDNRTRVLIQDEVETAKPVELTWTMHTVADVEIQGDRALLKQGAVTLEARLLAPAGATFTVEDVDIPPPQQPASGLRRLLVRLPDVTSVQLAVLFTPLRGSSSTSGATPGPGTLTPTSTATPTAVPGTPGTPGTLTPLGLEVSTPTADALPPPEIVDLSRWAATEAPLIDGAQT
jgi:hypothetical protein